MGSGEPGEWRRLEYATAQKKGPGTSGVARGGIHAATAAAGPHPPKQDVRIRKLNEPREALIPLIASFLDADGRRRLMVLSGG